MMSAQTRRFMNTLSGPRQQDDLPFRLDVALRPWSEVEAIFKSEGLVPWDSSEQLIYGKKDGAFTVSGPVDRIEHIQRNFTNPE